MCSAVCCGLTLCCTRGYPILSGTVPVNLPVVGHELGHGTVPKFSYMLECRYSQNDTIRSTTVWITIESIKPIHSIYF